MSRTNSRPRCSAHPWWADRPPPANCRSESLQGRDSAGGLTGDNDGTVANSFWDRDVSGRTASTGGTGKTTADMQKAGTFLSTGWDFVGEAANGAEDLWWIDEGQDYPRFIWEAAH